jgi:predicted alpha/beta hydrolase family esterase
MSLRIMIIPGNHDCEIEYNWYLSVKRELEAKGFHVVAEKMPDAYLATKEIWLPHIEKKVENSSKTILIGHSSGAVAIMRYLETHQIEGAILIGACHTDLGDETERLSNYYSTPWQWGKIKKNTKWIVQFASVDDPFIPIEEARFIHEQLETEYHEYRDQGHFGGPNDHIVDFPELVLAVLRKTGMPTQPL